MGTKPELLAPAGDMERLRMAVLYGADAVYLAGSSFGMRAFAGNFTPEELREAVREDTILVSVMMVNNEIGAVEPVTVKRADMERMSHLSTPPEVMAVYDIPSNELDESEFRHNLTIVLDRVQDPGNLGTIMRIADWFGIRQIVCSHDTVDVYNPKVVQATMGAISRVKVCYESLVDMLGRLDDVPVFGTFLDGDDIYSSELSGCGMIVFGNEGQGISPDVERLVSSRLTIPSFPPGAVTSESLNVGMAAAVTVAEFRRRIYC